MRLQDIATRSVVTVDPDDSIDKAIALMEEHRIRHLPVVRPDGTPVGMLSNRDILAAVGWLPQIDRVGADDSDRLPRRVGEIMSIPTISLAPEDRLDVAARLMLEERFGAVPIAHDDKLVGIVTIYDILRRFTDDSNQPRGRWRFEKVADFMRAAVFTLRTQDTLSAALRLMRQKQIRHVPIVADDAVIGMVSDHDVQRAVGLLAVERAALEDTRSLPPPMVTMLDIMTPEVATVDPADTLADAASLMLERKIGGLPVVSDRLLGIITETDLLHVFVAACEG